MLVYSGPSLLEHLDKMPMVDRKINAPLMMPVSEKYKDMGTVVVGKIESGFMRKGDTLLLMPNKNEVEVSVPTTETDINAAYEDAIHMLSTKPPKQEPKRDEATEQEDYYRTFRTKCVPPRSTYTPFG